MYRTIRYHLSTIADPAIREAALSCCIKPDMLVTDLASATWHGLHGNEWEELQQQARTGELKTIFKTYIG